MANIIQKILGRQKQTPDNEATLPLSQAHSKPTAGEKHLNSPLGWEFSTGQSVGRQREHNEDALFTFGSHLSFEDSQSFFGFFVIADGMGGYANGEFASGLAVRTMAEQIVKKIFNNYVSGGDAPHTEEVREILLTVTQEANRIIKKQVPGGGTTMTALLVIGNQLFISHVGDSRAYAISPDGKTQILTHDHSFVRQLVDLGQLSPEEAAVHPQRNILSMALGQWEPLEPDFVIQPVPNKGYLLLCTDGLWGVLPDNKIVQIIHSSDSTQETCHKLVEAANQAGGPDNITVILIRLPN